MSQLLLPLLYFLKLLWTFTVLLVEKNIIKYLQHVFSYRGQEVKWCFTICFAETPARPKSDISKINGVWFWFSVSIYSMHVLVWKTVLLPCSVCRFILVCVKCKQATHHCVIPLCRTHFTGYWTAHLVLEKSSTRMCCRIQKVTKCPQLFWCLPKNTFLS